MGDKSRAVQNQLVGRQICTVYDKIAINGQRAFSNVGCPLDLLRDSAQFY
jgi:hypothetical protein